MPSQAVLFDLFGTLVRFNVHVPMMRQSGREWRTTMPWLVETFRKVLPDGDFDGFLEAITEVTAEIVRNRHPEHLEVPSRSRFHRALCRLGLPPEAAEGHAETLSLAHMAHLASSVELPDGHIELLSTLSGRYVLGVLSNFDHAATARAILDRFALSPFFQTILISADIGRRKPHPAVFRDACKRLGISEADTIYVGDSPTDDIVGGKAAGMRVVWVNAAGRALPEGVPHPDSTISSLTELRAVLG